MIKLRGHTLVELIVVGVIIVVMTLITSSIYKAYQDIGALSVTNKS